MKTFLQHVADTLLERHGSDLSKVAVVFPNKRAALFLNQLLVSKAERMPMFSPRYITISELFRSRADRVVMDRIEAITRLYALYKQPTPQDTQTTATTSTSGTDSSGTNSSSTSNSGATQDSGTQPPIIDDTIDRFWTWGEVILSDFDDIDKQMRRAAQVLHTVRDLHAYHAISSLTPEQKDLLGRFFEEFRTMGDSLLRRRFAELWNRLYTLYSQLAESLASEGTYYAYEGALYRSVVEQLEREGGGRWPCDKYYFVGFNHLNEVEKRLLQAIGHDKVVTLSDNETEHSAAQAMASEGETKNVTYISANTENIQARYIKQWLLETPPNGSHPRYMDGAQTAIVLSDETLLRSVLQYLPDGKDLAKSTADNNGEADSTGKTDSNGRALAVNVTLGYPLSQTQVSTFVKRYMIGKAYAISKQQSGAVLQPLAEKLDDMIAAIEDDPFALEAAAKMRSIVARLIDLQLESVHKLLPKTLLRLVDQIVAQTTIPFHGEPIAGIQIMGMLETRNLDFKHVLLLSANEGNLPRGVNEASMIPYFIRRAHGLTTTDNKVAIYKHYFDRLLLRCPDATLAYNCATDDTGVKQMSRFMMQYMLNHNVERKNMVALSALPPRLVARNIEKSDEVRSLLRNITRISPSALGQYLHCPARFYYLSVRKLYEPEADTLDDPRNFGTLLHEAAENLYSSFKDGLVSKTTIAPLLNEENHATLRQFVNQAVATMESKFREAHREWPDDGMLRIQRQTVLQLLINLLEADSKGEPYQVLGCELKVELANWPYAHDGITGHITLKGNIARQDLNDNGTRMRKTDNKTGKPKDCPKDMADIFSGKDLTRHQDYYLQALLYCIMAQELHLSPDTARQTVQTMIEQQKNNPQAVFSVNAMQATNGHSVNAMQATNGHSVNAMQANNVPQLPAVPALLFVKSKESLADPVLRLGGDKIESMLDSTDSGSNSDSSGTDLTTSGFQFTASGTDFKRHLSKLLYDIFISHDPFTPKPNNFCDTCPYQALCKSQME